MRFHYKLTPAKHPVHALGGRWVRPRPLIMVTLLTASGTVVREALLDNGADDTVFPESAALKLGLDLTHAPVGEAMGVGSQLFPVRYAQVTIRVVQGREQREWPAWVGFTPARLNRPLLGFAGFMQFFTTTHYGDQEEVELMVNALYPGT
jgi:hypothetical protein